VRQQATWIATGNNIRLAGDLPRRCYWSRLDAERSRPWERKGFKHPDLLGWVGEHRGELLAALLTMVRAWIVAGKLRANVRPLGSFERWAETIGGILEYAGLRRFLGNLDELYDRIDEDGPAWEGFLRAWLTTFGDQRVTVADLVGELERDGQNDLRDALPDDLADAWAQSTKTTKGSQSFRVKLGRALRSREHRRFGEAGYYLTRHSKDATKKTVRWSVQISAPESPGSAESVLLRSREESEA
jgi:hypothetical protein